MSHTLELRFSALKYCNSDTNWCVLSMVGDDGVAVTVTGTVVHQLHPGDRVEVVGDWVDHHTYGRQLCADVIIPARPGDAEAMRQYLASGVLRGIGPVLAGRIVDEFGDDTYEVLDSDPDRLVVVTGISAKKARAVGESWRQNSQMREVMLSVVRFGVTADVAGRIAAHFGSEAMTVIRDRPYDLTRVRGVGFALADQVARGLGMQMDDPQRLQAGVVHVLRTASSQDGHCFLPLDDVIGRGAEVLGVGEDMVADAIDQSSDSVVMCRDGRVYLPSLWDCEELIAECLSRVCSADSWPTRFDLSDVDEFVAEQKLVDEQRDAVVAAVRHPVSVLTGGPGCGKSYTIGVLVEYAMSKDISVVLMAPTGRAAHRMGHGATTIHRRLNLGRDDDGDGVEDSDLSADLIIVDEMSMVDVYLFRRLMTAVRNGSHIVIVGDPDQLPSVGPGQVLWDVIASQAVPVTRLVKIFRQESGTDISLVAQEINVGRVPDTRRGSYRGFAWWPTLAGEVPDRVVDTVASLVPQRLGMDVRQVQVLAPMRRGDCGVVELNRLLQQRLNPQRVGVAELAMDQIVYRVGDRVMQTVNNYDLDIYNGTLGYVESIDTDSGDMTIVTEDGSGVCYSSKQISQLTLAYATTIHKSQGSEFPVVVIPLTNASWVMLRRNLLYTAVTRARRQVIVVGEPSALNRSVTNMDTRTRHTSLEEMITALFANRKGD